MADILREGPPNMAQPWGCLGVGGDLWPQNGVHMNSSPHSPVVGYEPLAPIDDDELKVSTE